MNTQLELAKAAAFEAGNFLQGKISSAQVVVDDRRDLKLDVDKQAEAIILDRLGDAYPILCEESGWIGTPDDTYWIVDGLDGSVNFYHDIPLAVISIGFVRQGKPVVGVIYDFIHKEIFSGAVGFGATLNSVPMQVSGTSNAASALFLTALAPNSGFDEQSLCRFGQRLAQWRKVRMFGSASLSLAYIASGRADACEIQGIMNWDVMAGLALVIAAGGYVNVTHHQDNIVDIVATNGKLDVGALV